MVGQYISSLRRLVQFADGTEIEVPEYASPVKNGDDDNPPGGPIVGTGTAQASEYAKRYLHKQVLPRVRQRLAILAGNGEDVREVAIELIAEIWVIVETLETTPLAKPNKGV